MDVLWIDPAVGPVEIGDALDQPALVCHLSQMGFDARMIVEGENSMCRFLVFIVIPPF